MKKEIKYLLIYILLALLPIIYYRIYYSFIYSNYRIATLSDKVTPLSLELLGIVFFIIIVSKYTSNIQYKTYGILLLSTLVQTALDVIIFLDNSHNLYEFYYNLYLIVFYSLILVFVIGSISQFLKYRNKETILLSLCLLIIRYIMYSGPIFHYISRNFDLWIYNTYIYVISLLVISVSGYVIYKSVKNSEYNLSDNS